METIARIRLEHFQNGKGIKHIAHELRIARDTVRKVLRSGATEFTCKRRFSRSRSSAPGCPVPTQILEREAKLPKRERRSTRRLFEELRLHARFGSPILVHRQPVSPFGDRELQR